MSDLDDTPRSRVRQIPGRAEYDRQTIYQIVDQAPICHVGFSVGGQPYVIPNLHAREGDTLLLHGDPDSRLVQHLQAGHPVCVSFALMDGWVLGKAACSHSLNYRSVVLFGTGHLLDEPAEKLHALELLTERTMPGRWREVRPPDESELSRTAIVAIRIEEASAKGRSGPPRDRREDRELEAWAGVVPIRSLAGTPEPADYTRDPNSLPSSVRAFLRTRAQA